MSAATSMKDKDDGEDLYTIKVNIEEVRFFTKNIPPNRFIRRQHRFFMRLRRNQRTYKVTKDSP